MIIRVRSPHVRRIQNLKITDAEGIYLDNAGVYGELFKRHQLNSSKFFNTGDQLLF